MTGQYGHAVHAVAIMDGVRNGRDTMVYAVWAGMVCACDEVGVCVCVSVYVCVLCVPVGSGGYGPWVIAGIRPRGWGNYGQRWHGNMARRSPQGVYCFQLRGVAI